MEITSPVIIRPIQAADNPMLASIVRNTLAEFGANKPGTVFYDPTTDHLFELFRKKGSMYLVAEIPEMILGGAGIYPTEGLPEAVCELVKIYLRPEARKKGLGRLLIEKCLDAALNFGYRQVYLESMPELKQAVGLYEKFGFKYLEGPLGQSGHYGCGIWMLKTL